MTARRSQARRRIAVVTGTRAEYGSLATVMRAIAADPRLELQLVVTGMHLLKKFGHTIDAIVRDGWRIDARVPMQTGSDAALDHAEGLARGVAGIARYLHRAQTHIVLVLGDRIEALAGALAAVTSGCVLAHSHGGDVAPGDLDESLRHAMTKLAHVHLAATRGAARRILRMGEQPQRVHVVGGVGLDQLREVLQEERGGHGSPRATACYDQPHALVVFHACGRPAAVEQRAMQTILRAVHALRLRHTILYPNSDRGHPGVIRAIEAHGRRYAGAVTIHRSLPRVEYLRLLVRSAVLVGNSSSGIIEAPFAGTPTVDIGPRQLGREPGGQSVLHVGETDAEIRAGLQRALRMRPRAGQQTVYGDGHAGERVAHILADLRIDARLLRKTITY